MFTIKFLISLTQTLVPKQLNLIRRHRKGRGNPISSSLPRHGARIRNKSTQQKNRKKKQKQKLRADCKLAQKNIEQEELYDA